MRLSRLLCSDAAKNAIKHHFLQKIKFSGPITVAEYMKTCLYQPQYGFYSKNPLGRHGHFITSPEISSLFGEMLGIWAARQWENMGCPVPFSYVDMGPGRDLMCGDILHAFCRATDVTIYQIDIKLVEISDALKKIQKERISSALKKSQESLNIEWYTSIMDFSVKSPFVLFANEFFDAMPIHIYKKSTTRWLEVLLDVDENDNFILTQSPNVTASLSLIPNVFHGSNHIYKTLSIISLTGTALIIDYGHDDVTESHDSFRAFYSHTQVDPMEEPRERDLTADVNFAYLRHLLGTDNNDYPVRTYGFVDQGDFLMQMGIYQRLQDAMSSASNEEKAKQIFTSFQSITSPQHMGSKFKVLAVQSQSLPEPLGFMIENDDE
ncbi:protein arginine methyltransferase NDUFAF7, mitochondrial-like [Convolutriloba macropyga]|uniref:protein arginine methyltransferase NDUFAF7, mitochondrial-like n=1 Tax=Convolutriloba macropyga TaxID=536237 RepID=UPI003F51DA40